MKFKDKKVLVFGSGISGVSAAALLLQEGAEVVLYDGNDRLDAAGIKEQIEGQIGRASCRERVCKQV